MKQVKKSVLLWYAPHEIYQLVTDVEAYPQFLPWCERVEVLARGAEGLTARVFSRQWLGDQTHLGLELAGCSFVAVADGLVPVQVGEQIPLVLPLAALHLFDRASGTALRHGLDAETKAA